MKTSKAKRNRVREMWLGMPETWRTELMSAFHTFVPAFIGALLISLETIGEVSLTKEFLIAVVIAALRSGFKAVSMWFMTRFLPDPKS